MKVYIGIDWSENKHDMVVLNEAGAIVAEQTIPHSEEGFMQLDRMRRKTAEGASDCLVALETAHNLLIDFLWSQGYSQVYVVPPVVVKANRGRYGASGARNDRKDAFTLADILRTDAGRLQPWHPDSLLTRQIRAKVSLISYLNKDIVATSNRLRAILLRYYPAAVGLFSSLTTQIAPHFIIKYPTPQAAASLSYAEFMAFAREHRYPKVSQLPARFAHLQDRHPEGTPETVRIYQDEAALLAAKLQGSIEHRVETERELKTLFHQHPDFAIFDSLPGAGELIAPALLAKFGDDRQRFPTAGSVQAVAGTCPVTDESGKRKIAKFRYACDRNFRRIAQQWAKAAIPVSPWAAGYWTRIRPTCHSNSHAYRCIANRLLAIAWKLWQTHQTYDEDYHLQQCALRRKPPN